MGDEPLQEQEQNKKEKEEQKVEENDPFYIDIAQKMNAIDIEYMKKCVPSEEQMAIENKKRWKHVLWKTNMGKFELQSNVELICLEMGKWSEEDKDTLFGLVTKYGINSKSAWQSIASDLNREVDDVMKKYSKLVSMPLKQLKKMAVARG